MLWRFLYAAILVACVKAAYQSSLEITEAVVGTGKWEVALMAIEQSPELIDLVACRAIINLGHPKLILALLGRVKPILKRDPRFRLAICNLLLCEILILRSCCKQDSNFTERALRIIDPSYKYNYESHFIRETGRLNVGLCRGWIKKQSITLSNYAKLPVDRLDWIRQSCDENGYSLEWILFHALIEKNNGLAMAIAQEVDPFTFYHIEKTDILSHAIKCDCREAARLIAKRRALYPDLFLFYFASTVDESSSISTILVSDVLMAIIENAQAIETTKRINSVPLFLRQYLLEPQCLR